MDWGEPLAEVEEVLVALEKAQAQVATDVAEGLKLGDQLRDAARNIAESSSGSWVGWHSRMYYGDYEKPPLEESWDNEWGGLSNFSPRWQERSLREVQRAIEDRAGVSLGDVGRIADRVREVCQPLQQEFMTVLSPVCDLAGFVKEAELLAKLENIKWIVPPGNFVRALASDAPLASRDANAVMQGKQAPHHLEVEAAIVTNTSTLTTSRDFLTDAIRLARQVRMKLNAMPSGKVMALPIDAGTDRLEHELWRRSVGLFAVLAIGIVVGELWLLRTFGTSRLMAAIIAVAGVLVLGGIYAWLLNRAHVRWVFLIGAGVLGAIAALDQILGHFLP
jgi:hypothetical protein